MKFQIERKGQLVTLYEPLPHQIEFHQSTARYCLMEGGRGSGKSLAMRNDAYMRCFATPRFRALIVRRTMPELKKSHLGFIPFERERMGLPDNAWHATDFILRFPNGSYIQFAHCEDDNALTKYLSSEYEVVYFDELATFTLRQFKFICSSLRSPIPGFKPFMRGGTNPVGVGASWVKRWFIDKNPSKDEAPVKRDGTPSYRPADYHTIKSTMYDNPHVDRAAYEEILDALPSESLRKALRDGEWVIEGQMFSEFLLVDPETGRGWHAVKEPVRYKKQPIWYASHIDIVRVLDWGYSEAGNPGVCLWFALLPDGGAFCFQEYVFKQTIPEDCAQEIIRLSAGMRVRYTVGDTAMWQEHEGPSIAEKIAGAGIGMIEADKARIPGWVEMHTWLKTPIVDLYGKRPKLQFLDSWIDPEGRMWGCPTALRTIPSMLIDPKDPNDILTEGVEDDCSDCVRYFVMSRPGKSKAPIEGEVAREVRKIIKRRQFNQNRIGTESMRRVA